jgi:hypothetical protein
LGHAYGRWIFPPLFDSQLQNVFNGKSTDFGAKTSYYKTFIHSLSEYYIERTVPCCAIIQGRKPDYISCIYDPDIVCENCYRVAPLNCFTLDKKINFYFKHPCIFKSDDERKDKGNLISLDNTKVTKYIEQTYETFSNDQKLYFNRIVNGGSVNCFIIGINIYICE